MRQNEHKFESLWNRSALVPGSSLGCEEEPGIDVNLHSGKSIPLKWLASHDLRYLSAAILKCSILLGIEMLIL
jgi:hypothetical protein